MANGRSFSPSTTIDCPQIIILARGVEQTMKQNSVSELNPQGIQAAISKCQKSIAENSPSAEMQVNLGRLYAQQQKWHQAKQSYLKAIDIDAEFATAHLYLAEVWTCLKKPRKAADSFYLAYKLNPSLANPQQHHKLGKTLEKQNKLVKAISVYHLAIKNKPDFLAAYRNLGNLLLEKKDKQKAIELYRQGITNNPEDPQFYLLLGKALAEFEEWDRALESYKIAVRLEPNLPDPYYHFGLVLANTDRLDLAEGFYKKAISIDADYWQAYVQLGILWQKQKKWEFALTAYRKVRALEPERYYVLNRMAGVYRQLKRYDLAIACHREVIKNSPENSPVEAKAICEYGKTLERFTDANIQHYYQRAKLLRAKGCFDDAIAAYQETIELDPQFKLPYIDLQYTPGGQNKREELIDFYRRIVEKNPDVTIAWGNLGDALSAQNLLPEAIECYRKGSYREAIQNNPDLAKLNWSEKKESAPDFIIAGASKSGTSSIYIYLGFHPQILLPHKKEIDFYWKNYKRGLDWYLAHFPTITDRPDFLTGEATPNYLRFPEVADRIKEAFPNTKIIILLRNPADRAISWHYHKFNTGLTNKDLAEEIAKEMENLKDITEEEITTTHFANPDNIISSLYYYKLKPWIETLGREQFLILKSEDFYQNPDREMAKVYDFLDLPHHSLDNYPKINVGSYNEVDSSLRATLVEYFAPYNQKLEEYLGMKFNWQ